MFPEGGLSETHLLAALLGISEMVAGLTDREEVLGTIVRITPQLVGADRCAILVYDERKREFHTEVVHGPDRERNAVYQRIVITEDEVRQLAHRILEQKLPALVRETSFPRQLASVLGIRMALVVPLVCKERTLGIMIIDHTTRQRPFTSKEINVVTGVAQQAAIAIDNFRLQEEARRAKEGVQRIGELLADGVLTLTEDFRLIGLDPAGEILLQWKNSDVVGKSLAEAFEVTHRDGTRLPENPQAVDRAFQPVAGHDPPALYFRRKDGSRVLCTVFKGSVRDDFREVVEYVCALRRLSITVPEARISPVRAGVAQDSEDVP